MNEMKSHWYFQGSLCGLSVGENFFLYMEYLLTVCVAWGTTEKAHVFFQRRVGDSCFISAFIFVRTTGVDECDSVFFPPYWFEFCTASFGRFHAEIYIILLIHSLALSWQREAFGLPAPSPSPSWNMQTYIFISNFLNEFYPSSN